MLSQLAEFRRMALDLLFPQWCVGCGSEGFLICSSCQAALPRLLPPLCPKCGRTQPSGILCPSCISWQAEIDGIRSPFRFDGVVRQAIHQLKYRNLRAIIPFLADLLNDYLTLNPLPGDVLVPVPLHRQRLRERGYNQSALLARGLGKLANLPVASDCLVRERGTPAQARTSTVDGRRRNVAGAFTCRDGSLRDRAIIVIDDVATSGATLNACAQALKAAGAASVWGLTFAREI